ncbi:hypothetical protein ES703_58649 [subsurface metagenome]
MSIFIFDNSVYNASKFIDEGGGDDEIYIVS